jgi:hypothetical protein
VFKKQDPISKIISIKKAGVMTQVIQHLPRKHKALKSNASTTTKIKQQQKDHGLKLDS